MKPTAVAYVRVSSASQTHTMQREAIERAAKARGDKLVDWYVDTWTGATTERPELSRLRTDARAGGLRRLYVYRLDRLSRGGIRATLEVVEELRAHGVELLTLGDGFDLGGPAAEIVLAVLAWSAKMERLAINERISQARAQKAARGERWGRPPRLTGPELEHARALLGEGRSIRKIAVAIRVPRSTVQRALSAHK
jgi:DNA invertase Pin-like site-specific DNA recombinase